MARFNSEPRSVSAVTTCTGLPDSRPSHALNCSGELDTNRPSSLTGMPSDLQRFTTETGCPRNSAISFHPFSVVTLSVAASLVFEPFGILSMTLLPRHWRRGDVFQNLV